MGEMKRIILMSGGDWHDASFDCLIIHEKVDLKKEKAKWQEWYDNKYFPKMKIKYLSFSEWLIKKKIAKEDSIERIHEEEL